MNLNEIEKKVLAFLATGSEDFGVYSFDPIARHTKVDRKAVRRACRSLKRKGLTEFHSGCWTQDGEPAGSGYGITNTGRDMAEPKLVEAYELKLWW